MTERTYTMSKKELDRFAIIKQVLAKRLTQKVAASDLGISQRHLRRLITKYKKFGEVGLISKKRGCQSNNHLPIDIVSQVKTLLEDKYNDFGPTLACEKLKELHGIKISTESLRKLMIQMDLWQVKKKKYKKSFQMRSRRPRFGELVQIDGSPHDWFEGRSESCTLLVFIDDANSNLLYLQFVPTETTNGYMAGVKSHLQNYGRPVAYYSDRHSIFRINANEPEDGNNLTQFSRALKTLDIECIHARTPQAKGRVERVNKTLQDRLVKEMRLANINTMEEGNAFLSKYIEIFNSKFSVMPTSKEDAHRKLHHNNDELATILSKHYTRKLSKNLICQFENTKYQIQTSRQGYALRGTEIAVCQDANDNVKLYYKGKEMAYITYKANEKPPALEDEKSLNKRVSDTIKQQTLSRKWKPSENHPWNKRA